MRAHEYACAHLLACAVARLRASHLLCFYCLHTNLYGAVHLQKEGATLRLCTFSMEVQRCEFAVEVRVCSRMLARSYLAAYLWVKLCILSLASLCMERVFCERERIRAVNFLLGSPHEPGLFPFPDLRLQRIRHCDLCLAPGAPPSRCASLAGRVRNSACEANANIIRRILNALLEHDSLLVIEPFRSPWGKALGI